MIKRLSNDAQSIVSIDLLLQEVTSYLPDANIELIERAYKFAYRAHGNQRRASGEPYINHLLSTALILADFRLDEASLAAALLHDVIEDTDCSLDSVTKEFGSSIADMVNGVTKLTQTTWEEYENQRDESMTKMFLAMARDIRVVMIKLADRLHNMRTLGALHQDKQVKIARETMDIYAPLSYRLGIWSLKSELEDLAFYYLQPDDYKHISELLDKYQVKRESLISSAIEVVDKELHKAGITAELVGRAKHLYGIYQKMLKRGKEFDQVYDVFAIRIVVSEIRDCYAALGVVHSLWPPVPNRVKDYIAAPRNLYRSLHTTVLYDRSIPLEVQIRTHKMHTEAKYGVAAHWQYRDWRYKQHSMEDSYFAERVAWLQQLVELRREIPNARDFVEMLKSEMFLDRVYAFTPKGKLIDLPVAATPIDFAYQVHTEIGHRCRGARVNGKLVSLDYQLRSGDQVEILTARRGGPSRDWLNPSAARIGNRTSHKDARSSSAN